MSASPWVRKRGKVFEMLIQEWRQGEGARGTHPACVPRSEPSVWERIRRAGSKGCTLPPPPKTVPSGGSSKGTFARYWPTRVLTCVSWVRTAAERLRAHGCPALVNKVEAFYSEQDLEAESTEDTIRLREMRMTNLTHWQGPRNVKWKTHPAWLAGHLDRMHVLKT